MPPAVEAYQNQKQQGAVIMSLYGTPQTHALNERLEADHMPTTSPGFGIAASADGKRYPYLFPIAATYFSQGAAAVDFAKRQLGGSLKGKKIAYVVLRQPGRQGADAGLRGLAETEGFDLRTFAVPPPGVEMGAQVLDITQRYRPDFVITHLFGRSPSVAIKELKRAAIRCRRCSASSGRRPRTTSRRPEAGASPRAITRCSSPGAGDDYPIRQEIKEMYKKQGKEPPKEMENTVIYNRGLLQAAVQVEAIRNALKLNGGKQPTGEDVKKGFEQIKGFTLGGLVPPLEITPEDHEGGGWVKIFTVKGGKFVPDGDWFKRLSRSRQEGGRVAWISAGARPSDACAVSWPS